MIALLTATLALTNPIFEAELGTLIDPASIEGVSVQEACSFWIAEGGAEAMRAEMAAYAAVCWEFPMSELDTFGQAMDAQLTEARWGISEAMGYSMVYVPVEPSECLQQMVVSLMTKDEPFDPEMRVTADTAVMLFMTPREDLEACG